LLANELPVKYMTCDVAAFVSIHIRHCWRMNFVVGRFGSYRTGVSIHIRHCWRMNSTAKRDLIDINRFQSTFAIAGE